MGDRADHSRVEFGGAWKDDLREEQPILITRYAVFYTIALTPKLGLGVVQRRLRSFEEITASIAHGPYTLDQKKLL